MDEEKRFPFGDMDEHPEKPDSEKSDGELFSLDKIIHALQKKGKAENIITVNKDSYHIVTVVTVVGKSAELWNNDLKLFLNGNEVEPFDDPALKLSEDKPSTDPKNYHNNWGKFIEKVANKHHFVCDVLSKRIKSVSGLRKLLNKITKQISDIRKKMKKILISLTATALLFSIIGITFVNSDSEKPKGKITIQNSYRTDQNIEITIEADDNKALGEILFEIKKENVTIKQVKKEADKDSRYIKEVCFFPKGSLECGNYTYSLSVRDKSGNSQKYPPGSFEVKEKKIYDPVKPLADAMFEKEEYAVGEEVKCTIKASDNIALQKVRFEVKQESVSMNSKSWEPTGKEFNEMFPLETSDWKEGTYTWEISATDTSGNISLPKQGKFDLKIQYGVLNIVTEGCTAKIFIDNEDKNRTTPYSEKFPSGRYRLKLKDSNDRTFCEEDVDIMPNQTTKIGRSCK